MITKILKIILTVVLLLAATLVFNQNMKPKTFSKESVTSTSVDYGKLISRVDPGQLKTTVEKLSGIRSRCTGTAGIEQVRNYMLNYLSGIGIKPIMLRFNAAVPITKEAVITVEGKNANEFEIYPMQPNGPRTCSTEPGGITGKIVYGGNGRLDEFDGKDLKENIVLLNNGGDWQNAAMLGAKAILFLGSDSTTNRNGFDSSMPEPVNIPRFTICLRNRFGDEKTKAALLSLNNTTANIKCRVDWEKHDAYDLLILFPGNDPSLKKTPVILSAFYDSASPIPDIAPGAESACSVAALLEITKILKEFPLKRDVYILFTEGHYQGLSGMREFLNTIGVRTKTDGKIQEFKKQSELAKTDLDLSLKAKQILETGQPWETKDKAIKEVILRNIGTAIETRLELSILFQNKIEGLLKSFEQKSGEQDEFQKIGSDFLTKKIVELSEILKKSLALTSDEKIRQQTEENLGILDKINELQKQLAEKTTDSDKTKTLRAELEQHLQSLNKIGEFKQQQVMYQNTMLAGLPEFKTIYNGIFKDVAGESIHKTEQQIVERQKEIENLTIKLRIAQQFSMYEKPVFISLEISSRNRTPCIFVGGPLYNAYLNNPRQYRPIADLFESLAKDTEELLGVKPGNTTSYMCPKCGFTYDPSSGVPEDKIPANTPFKEVPQNWCCPKCKTPGKNFQKSRAETFVNLWSGITKKHPESVVPVDTFHETELMDYRGYIGVTILTSNVLPEQKNTPFDTSEKINFDNLIYQTRLLSAILPSGFNYPDFAPVYMQRTDGFCQAKIHVVKLIKGVSFTPTYRIPDSLVFTQYASSQITAVTPFITIGPLMTDDRGEVYFDGPINTWNMRSAYLVSFKAYKVDDNGNVVYTNDLGMEGEEKYPSKVLLNTEKKEVSVVVFRCEPTNLFGLTDPRHFVPLSGISAFDADTGNKPEAFGFDVASNDSLSGKQGASSAVYYSEPGKRFKIIMFLTVGSAESKRLLLLNVDENNPIGKGFTTDELNHNTITCFQVAKDMWQLDESRFNNLKRFGIKNEILDTLHQTSGTFLEASKKNVSAQNYSEGIEQARSSWGYEARAYPYVIGTADDAIKGIIFYLFLLIPFSFFMERLLFGFPDIKKQLFTAFAVFIVIFIVLQYAHPAFQLVLSPLLILLSFIILALAILVITMISGRFSRFFIEMKRKSHGEVKQINASRMETSMTAFSLGISNMRKRKGRTILTSATLILLTFTVLSFTSVKSSLQLHRLKMGDATYDGLLIKKRGWDHINPKVIDILQNKYSRQFQVVSRAWRTAKPDPNGGGLRLYLDVARTDNPQKIYQVQGLLFLMPEEKDVTKIDKTIAAGSWFKKSDEKTCIIPRELADKLSIKPEDLDRVEISIFTRKYRVTGISDSRALALVNDLNAESIMPVDPTAFQDMAIEPPKEEDVLNISKPEKSSHLPPEQVLILPFDEASNFGGLVYTTVVNFNVHKENTESPEATVKSLLSMVAFDVFAGINGTSYYYSSTGMSSFSGLKNIFIPLLIVSLIVLNTMLGSVHERLKEISVYSSVGLAPMHVAMLFIAEASVYATLGAIIGYLGGQLTTKILLHFNLLAGLTLNYSSTSAVLTTIIVMLMVIASTIYPARQAARLAAPASERKWKLPEPKNDIMSLELPFTFSTAEVTAVVGFLKTFFDVHEEGSSGAFLCQTSRCYMEQRQFGQGKVVEAFVWIAPYDLGVSQTVRLILEPTDAENIFTVALELHLKSGDIKSWQRTNRFFLTDLRKYFLNWRTISDEERNMLLAQGQQLIGETA